MRRHVITFGLVVSFVSWACLSSEATVPRKERDALVALYYTTNGQSWTNRTGWLGEAGTECQWYGIICDEAQTTVIGINLTANGLVPS